MIILGIIIIACVILLAIMLFFEAFAPAEADEDDEHGFHYVRRK